MVRTNQKTRVVCEHLGQGLSPEQIKKMYEENFADLTILKIELMQKTSEGKFRVLQVKCETDNYTAIRDRVNSVFGVSQSYSQTNDMLRHSVGQPIDDINDIFDLSRFWETETIDLQS